MPCTKIEIIDEINPPINITRYFTIEEAPERDEHFTDIDEKCESGKTTTTTTTTTNIFRPKLSQSAYVTQTFSVSTSVSEVQTIRLNKFVRGSVRVYLNGIRLKQNSFVELSSYDIRIDEELEEGDSISIDSISA